MLIDVNKLSWIYDDGRAISRINIGGAELHLIAIEVEDEEGDIATESQDELDDLLDLAGQEDCQTASCTSYGRILSSVDSAPFALPLPGGSGQGFLFQRHKSCP